MATATATKERQDLRMRTATFAKQARSFVHKTPRTFATMSDFRQLAKSSGFLGKHYLQACGADDTNGYLKYIITCRDEARFTSHWLDVLDGSLEEKNEKLRSDLSQESQELEKIFGAIIHKIVSRKKS